jgi:nitrogen fixation/metabolism regulation signal transduction histidine kinase
MVHMVPAALRRLLNGFFPILVLFLLLLVSLYLMSAATENSEQFGRLYFSLLLINVLGLVALLALIGTNLSRMIRQYRRGATGSRLTVRLMVIFVVLALVPVTVVYYFSLRFIQRGIDTWYDVRVEQAFDDALELSRLSLDDRKRDYLRKAQQLSEEFSLENDAQATLIIDQLRDQSGAVELTLLSPSGHIIAASSINPLAVLPHLPDEGAMRQARHGNPYIGIDPVPDIGLQVRVVITVPSAETLAGPRVLQGLFPVSDAINTLAGRVFSSYTKFKQLSYLRGPLKFSFTVTLSLVLLLSLLTAVWAAFFSARRLVAPIRVLAIGTRAVASGDYSRQLPMHSHDELGFLVRSFNDMTRRIAHARDEAEHSKQQAEGERAYLRAVLGRLSSGVLTLDNRNILRTANAAAGHIFGVDFKDYLGKPLMQVSHNYAILNQFVNAIRPNLQGGRREWREEVVLFGASGRQVLACGGALLPGVSERGAGSVIVCEDVTTLVQAQRDAAWGEVARRLAHEIKNPLTPIRLSAERLRHKYLKTMAPADAEVLDRATHTIVQQVELMEEMVKAFSDYARSPQLKLRVLDLNTIVSEVLDLYRGEAARVHFHTMLANNLPRLELDSGRMRQLLHNLIKNSLEASAVTQECHIEVHTACVSEAGRDMVEMRLNDNGPGIPRDMLGRFFEPYVTTKPKGTGLGLAIVKKIVEEHGGVVWAENPPDGGAAIVVRLPILHGVGTEAGVPPTHNGPADA